MIVSKTCAPVISYVLAVPTVLSVPLRAAPSEVLVVSDNRHDLSVHVRNSEDHIIGTGIESIITAIGSRGVVLGCASSDEEGKKS